MAKTVSNTNVQNALGQCFSTFLMSPLTFRRDFDFGPTSRKICFRTHD